MRLVGTSIYFWSIDYDRTAEIEISCEELARQMSNKDFDDLLVAAGMLEPEDKPFTKPNPSPP